MLGDLATSAPKTSEAYTIPLPTEFTVHLCAETNFCNPNVENLFGPKPTGITEEYIYMLISGKVVKYWYFIISGY